MFHYHLARLDIPIVLLPKTVEKLSDIAVPKALYEGKMYYWCKICAGWIEGQPIIEREDSIGPLCGRRGSVTTCCRCGQEIAFFGMYA